MNHVSGAEGIAPVVVERPDCAEWNGAREDLERKTGRGVKGEEKMRFRTVGVGVGIGVRVGFVL